MLYSNMPPSCRPTLHFRDGACVVTQDGCQIALYHTGGAAGPALQFAAAPQTASLLGSRHGPGCAFGIHGAGGGSEMVELLGRRGSASCGLKLNLEWRLPGERLVREQRTVRFQMVSAYSIAIDTLVQIWPAPAPAGGSAGTKTRACIFGWFAEPLLNSPAAVIQAPDGDHNPPEEFSVKSSWIAATGAPGGQPASVLLTTGLPGGEAPPRWSISPDGSFRADFEPAGAGSSAPCEWFTRIVLHNGAVNRAWCAREAVRSQEALAGAFTGITL